ncbi:hypothetical protein KA005_16535, partial [bacterium]|nr:hypothetical protein [bacterium]
MIRHFLNYPEERICNIYFYEGGIPFFKKSVKIDIIPPSPLSRPLSCLKYLSFRLWNALFRRLNFNKIVFNIAPICEDIRERIEKKYDFYPDIIYSTCFSYSGLSILHQLSAQYKNRVPIIQYFLDYQFPSKVGVNRLLRQVASHCSEIWALTQNIADDLSQRTNCTVTVRDCFHLDLPEKTKKSHKQFNSEFTCIIFGNVWNTEVLEDLKTIWKTCQEELSEVKPIEWICHPSTIERIKEQNISFMPELEYRGYFPKKADLFDCLINADMAIIPFNREDYPANDYARYSLPSRITELAAAGVPLFCFAGKGTPLIEYVKKHRIGECFPTADKTVISRKILTFIQDKEKRAFYGKNARSLAEREFCIEPYQSFLYN